MMTSEAEIETGQDGPAAAADGAGRPGGGFLPRELAEQLVAQARADGVRLSGPGGLLTGLTKMVLETALETELADHLGYDKGDPAGRGAGNVRNGFTGKTVQTCSTPFSVSA